MANTFSLNREQFEALHDAMERYGKLAGQTVNEVLHKEGGVLIQEEIMQLLPESGRKPWRGKKTAASRAQPFVQQNGSLSVTIKTKPAYHYLYFPDDGTNTKRHVGYKGKPREFMYQGATNQQERIMELCVNRLIKNWEGD